MYYVFHGGLTSYIPDLWSRFRLYLAILFQYPALAALVNFSFAFQYLCTHESLTCDGLEKYYLDFANTPISQIFGKF